MSFHGKSSDTGNRLAALVDNGVPVSEAAAALGISRAHAYAVLRKKGLAMSRGRQWNRPVDPDLIKRVFVDTGSVNQAAKRAEVAFSVARRVLVAEGMFTAAPTRGKSEAQAKYLQLIEQGWSNRAACAAVGVNERTGKDWKAGIRRSGQRRVRPDGVVVDYRRRTRYKIAVSKINISRRRERHFGPASAGERYLSMQNRLDIADGLLAGHSLTVIAERIGKHKSTVSREIRAHSVNGSYLPYRANQDAAVTRRRPKAAKLVTNQALRAQVVAGLACRRSPEQIAHRLRKDFPDDESMRVSHETIYQSLYLQARGGLRREVAQALRTGRALRTPRRHPGQRTPRFGEMIMISDRPAEIGDRAVPGHWEGDLIMGMGNKSAIGTLVERTTRYTMLVHLPNGHHSEAVRDGLIATISTLPEHLRGSLTWDQGTEMARHFQFSMATGMPVYFCDPASPWQRGSNENTNGLLRQYFPKSTDLSGYTPADLELVAKQLNDRPRKTLDWDTPAERLRDLLAA